MEDKARYGQSPTKFELGFKSGNKLYIGVKDGQKFLDQIKTGIVGEEGKDMRWWYYDEPGYLFSISDLEYIMPVS